MFTLHTLTFLLLYGKQNPPGTPDQCVFIRGFQEKRPPFWTRLIRGPKPSPATSIPLDEVRLPLYNHLLHLYLGMS